MKCLILSLIVFSACNNFAKSKVGNNDTSMFATITYKDGSSFSAYDTTDAPIVKVDTVYREDATII